MQVFPKDPKDCGAAEVTAALCLRRSGWGAGGLGKPLTRKVCAVTREPRERSGHQGRVLRGVR